MKSQVNALLHVLRGLMKDVQAAYPALKDGFSKDYGRIALLCQNRGQGVFTLDLPHLQSVLLNGLECGSLKLEGPLTQRVSKRIQVPRLFSGLWLLVFDADACLKREVDITAVAFLDQLLVLGKKLQVECSDARLKLSVGAYHDIERQLRTPSLDWLGDDIGLSRGPRSDLSSHFRDRDGYLEFLLREEDPEEEQKGIVSSGEYRHHTPNLSLHVLQALDWVPRNRPDELPLFLTEDEEDGRQRADDVDLLQKIQRVADLLISDFTPIDPVIFSDYLDQQSEGIGFKHGPGAVAERRKNWEKSQFTHWPQKLEGTFPFRYCGTVAAGKEMDCPSNHEVASRLIHVPKTAKSPRLIAAEPTSHQWCQQLLLKYFKDQMRTRFRGYFIDLKAQWKSGDLVLKASLDRSLATVDLSDASDRLSCWTVERLFRLNPSLLVALHAARTRYLRDEISADVSFLSLRKFASQGTATTFPVMSLVMLFIALGATHQRDEKITRRSIWAKCNQVRVFGDDIILPTHGYGRLVRAMDLLELKVNVAKSYVNGHFRESCGTDGYRGYDITPVKPETLVADSPASCQAVVDNSNNLFKKGYWNASTACIDLLPLRLQRRLRIVGRHGAGFRGVISNCGGDERHLDKRWNTRLHRWEVRVWSLSCQAREHPREGLSALLDFFSSAHNPFNSRIVSSYVDVRKTRVGLLWEPFNHDSHGSELIPFRRPNQLPRSC